MRHSQLRLILMTALLLGACSSGGDSSSTDTSTIAADSVVIVPYAGKFSSGSVKVKDANGQAVALLGSTGAIGSDGKATLSIARSAQYPLVAEVTGTYWNVAKGANETSTVPLRSFIQDITTATSSAGVAVTAITEIAVAGLEKKRAGTLAGMKAVNAVEANLAAEVMLGLPAGTAIQPPVFDVAGKTSDANTLKLAALAVAAEKHGTGADLADKVRKLATDIANLQLTESPSSLPVLAALPTELTNVTTGTLSVLSVGATAPANLAFDVPVTTVQTLQTDIATATVGVTSSNTEADNFIAAAVGTGIWESLWVTGEPATGVVATAYQKIFTAGATAGSYTSQNNAHELTNGSWITKTASTETYPSYYLNANTSGGWTLPPDTETYLKNADGSITVVNHPRYGTVTAFVTETDISGTQVTDPATWSPSSSVYPAGSRQYKIVNMKIALEHYRLWADKWSMVTDLNGIPLTTISGISSFCAMAPGRVYKPITPAPTPGTANYNFYFTASCSRTDIANATAVAPAGTILFQSKSTGNAVVPVVMVFPGATTAAWADIIGEKNGKVYSGMYRPVGNSMTPTYLNKTAFDAETSLAFPSAPALP